MADPPASRLPLVTAVSDDALGTDDAVAVAGRLARREVSPEEVTAAACARAHAVDPALNAVTTWVERRCWPPSDPDAPLAGIPIVIKDNEDLVGYPTSEGSRAIPGFPLPSSTPWTAQALRMGAAPIAKTTMPEFGLTAGTESSRFGATSNPWDPTRTPGGSSGGSAALVAAGVVPIAHANDGGGSIRIPAACCGLVGLKPSRGRLIDRADRARLPVPISVQGVLTRTVRDTAWYLAQAERAYRNPDLAPVGDVRGPSSQRRRIGLRTTAMPGLTVDAEVVAVVRAVAGRCASLGHHVDEIDVGVGEQFGRDFLDYWGLLAFGLRYGGRRLFGPGFDPRLIEPLTRALSRRTWQNAPHLPAALRRLRRQAQIGEPGMDGVDVVLCPVVTHQAPPLGHFGPQTDPTTHIVRLLRWVAFTPLHNVSGCPALALPVGTLDSGLPAAVQLVAPLGQERRLLQLAFELEAAGCTDHRSGMRSALGAVYCPGSDAHPGRP